MNRTSLRSICLIGLVGASLAANAQSKWKFDYIAVEAGAYFPKSSLLKDRFGEQIFRVGVSPIMVKKTPDWRPSFELGYMGSSSSGDHFAVIPLTVGVQKTFGDQSVNTVPFVRLAAGLAYFDYKVTEPDLSVVRDHKIGPVTAFEVGILSGDRFRASARYYLMSKQSGLDFSGILLSASYGLFKL